MLKVGMNMVTKADVSEDTNKYIFRFLVCYSYDLAALYVTESLGELKTPNEILAFYNEAAKAQGYPYKYTNVLYMNKLTKGASMVTETTTPMTPIEFFNMFEATSGGNDYLSEYYNELEVVKVVTD